MRQNNLAVPQATLVVVPDTADESYRFYIWQVVTFTATLSIPGGVADGKIVVFENVGSQHDRFVLFGSPDKDAKQLTDGSPWQVYARSNSLDCSVATATIRALYSSIALDADAPGIFIASLLDDTDVKGGNTYTVAEPNVRIEQIFDPYQLVPALSLDDTPSSSGGNYFVCSVYVSDSITGSALKDINFRLFSDYEHSFAGIKFYPDLNSDGKNFLTINYDENSMPSVDVLTNIDGVASVYVCAAKTSGTYAGVISGTCGVKTASVATFVIPDFKSVADPGLPAPQLPPSIVTIPSDDTIDSIACMIPAYPSNAIQDQIFVLCNRRVQLVGNSSFARAGTGAVSASFSKFGLHNETFEDDASIDNELTYIVLPLMQPAALASTRIFYAKGDPGPATRLHDGSEKAPTIVETLGHGVVINANTIAQGLTIRVPLGEQNPGILWDDVRYVVNVMLDVSGWMAGADDPMAVRIVSPRDREVSKLDIARGYVDIWFPRIGFWGFGQSVEGVMGYCDVQYTMTKIDSFSSPLPKILNRQIDSSTLPRSKILHCHIDTLPPSGLGSYFH